MALITRQEVLDWMGMAAGTSADAIIDKLIVSVSARCQQVACCTFEPVANVRDMTGDGTSVLVLPIRPVISVGEVSIEGGDVLEEGWDKDYVVEGAIIRLAAMRFSTRPGGNHIEWVSGFEDVPEDIKLSCWKAAAFDLKAQDKRREGITHFTTANQSADYIEEEYPKDVLDVWLSYKGKQVLVA